MSVPAIKIFEEDQKGNPLDGDSTDDEPILDPRDSEDKSSPSMIYNADVSLLDVQYPLLTNAENDIEAPKLGKHKRRSLGSLSQKKKRTEDVFVAPQSSDEVTSAIIKSKGSKVFTPERDMELRLAVEQFGTKWDMVKDYLKYPGVTKEQYQKRYTGYVSPEVENREKTPWTVELEMKLGELVSQNSELNRKGKESINWKKISKEMNRQYFDCQNRWNTLKKSTLIVGRFTAEEDETIVRVHDEWTGAGKGLWVLLESKLKRRNDVIRKRYNLLAKKAANARNEQPATADI